MTGERATVVANMNDEQLQEHALEILERELGAIDFARFLRVYRPASGRDYTRDRHKWQKGITVNQIMEQIKERRKESA